MRDFLSRNRYSLFSSLAAGALAYGFFLTEKLPNDDDLIYAFSKGVDLESGRFGLKIVSLIFPDYSMPSINGILSLFMLAFALAFLTELFEIRSRAFQILLPAVMIVFPSQIGIFAYTFALPAFSLAFLLTVLSVRAAADGSVRGMLLGSAGLIFVLSVYQAYLMLAAAFFLLLVLKDTLKPERSVGETVRLGLKYLLCLAAAMVLYNLILGLLFRLTDSALGKYAGDAAAEADYPLLRRIRSCVAAATGAFLPGKRYYGLTVNDFSAVLHLCGFALAVICLASRFLSAKKKDVPRFLLQLAVVFVLLPLSVSCIFLLTYSSVHTLVLHAFVSCYLLMTLPAETGLPEERIPAFARKAVPVLFALIAAVNIFAANRAALKLHYQNVYLESVCNQVMSSLQTREDFTEDARITFIGYPPATETIRQFDDVKIMGTDVISRKKYLKYYMGADFNYADQAEHDRLAADPRVAEMPCYPYNGYIRNVDGVICIKLGKPQTAAP